VHCRKCCRARRAQALAAPPTWLPRDTLVYGHVVDVVVDSWTESGPSARPLVIRRIHRATAEPVPRAKRRSRQPAGASAGFQARMG
jgi:hypothetical protein